MVAIPDPDNVLASGPYGTVEYAFRLDLQSEAKSWLDSKPKEIRRAFGVLFQRLVNEGQIHNTEQFRLLRDDVWEFKHRTGERIACYRLGRRWLLTHGFKKAGGRGKCPPAEIRHAEMIAREHIQYEMNLRKKQK